MFLTDEIIPRYKRILKDNDYQIKNKITNVTEQILI